MANSFIATAFAILFAVTSKKVFLIAFVAAIAEALADTVASGIGVISGKAYDVFRRKTCEPGISGGMSLLGTVSSLLAAAIIAFFAYLFGRINGAEVVIVILSAFLGAIFDSFLGSVVQVKYKCKSCGKVLEREEHCGERTEKYSGVKFVNNDVVNLLGTLFAGVFASVIYIL